MATPFALAGRSAVMATRDGPVLAMGVMPLQTLAEQTPPARPSPAIAHPATPAPDRRNAAPDPP